jgi:hypothetical protein
MRDLAFNDVFDAKRKMLEKRFRVGAGLGRVAATFLILMMV